MTVKKNVAIVLAMFCLVGCHRDFQDPLLRQQLTSTVAGLKDVPTEEKAISDIDAILSVNSEKLSKGQKDKLLSAEESLRKSLDGHTAFMSDDTNQFASGLKEWMTEMETAKKTIGEAAGTF
jgi:hypothetical protein